MKTSTLMLVLCTLGLLACSGRHGRNRATTPPPAPSAEELFQEGQARAQAGDPLRAEQYLAEALRRGYPAREGLPALLQVCINTSRLRLALRYAEPHLVQNPDDWPLRFLVATILHSLGDHERAYWELQRVLEAAPDQPEPHCAMARVMLDHGGDVAQARHHLQRHLELSPAGPAKARTRDLLWELDHRRAPAAPPVAPAMAQTERSSSPEAPNLAPPEIPALILQVDEENHGSEGGDQ